MQCLVHASLIMGCPLLLLWQPPLDNLLLFLETHQNTMVAMALLFCLPCCIVICICMLFLCPLLSLCGVILSECRWGTKGISNLNAFVSLSMNLTIFMGTANYEKYMSCSLPSHTCAETCWAVHLNPLVQS